VILDSEALIDKHKGRGVLVDANLLVLLIVGFVRRSRIETFKRTQNFTVQDFDLLRDLLEWLGQPLHATPHVLSRSAI
jgi:hypothetical protein